MARGHYRPKTCRVCGRRAADGFHISFAGNCLDHAKERFEENFDAMQTMSGPYAEHWRRQMARSVGALLVDDAAEAT